MRLIVSAVLLWAAVIAAPLAAEPMPVLGGNTAIHDPSIIATEDGWASFATGVERAADGGAIRTKTSPDGITWTETGPLPGGIPAWVKKELGFAPRNIWAPSVSRHGDTVYLYYSVSSFGRNNSVIGLMTNAAFDAARPAEGWEDKGLVFRSRRDDWLNAIDPFRIDVEDRAFLAFGSYWDGIRMIELDPVTGLRKGEGEPLRLASRNGDAIEASAVLEHEGKFYLFVSFDACCKGLDSTYRIMVGRADTVEGPYVDRDGKPMLDGGGTQLLATTGRFIGPGGQEVFDADGAPWLAFHYYDGEDGGTPKLQLAPLGWSADGWPELGALPQP
jgi:arabinan endo-1,5-alpha-L-arabinosidase